MIKQNIIQWLLKINGNNDTFIWAFNIRHYLTCCYHWFILGNPFTLCYMKQNTYAYSFLFKDADCQSCLIIYVSLHRKSHSILVNS